MHSKKNKLIVNFDSTDSILFVDRQRLDSAYLYSLFAAAINNKYKKKIYLLSDKNKNDDCIDVYKKFGLKNFLIGVNKFQYFKHFIIFFKSLCLSWICITKIRQKNFLWFINNYKVTFIE